MGSQTEIVQGAGSAVPERTLSRTFTYQQLQSSPASTTTTPSVSMSRIRQNFEEASEALINKQINMEFYASYVYLSMSAFFNRDDQALHGFAKFFKKSSDEEREHGMKLMEYQTKRGGRTVFQDISKPTTMEWGTPLQAMLGALELEKTVNQSLLDLHAAAGEKGDAHLCDFLEANYLDEQVEGIKEISDMVTKLKGRRRPRRPHYRQRNGLNLGTLHLHILCIFHIYSTVPRILYKT